MGTLGGLVRVVAAMAAVYAVPVGVWADESPPGRPCAPPDPGWLQIMPQEPPEAVPPPVPLVVPQRVPRDEGMLTLTFARYRNDGSLAAALDAQRYLTPADRRVRMYFAGEYGRENYTTLVATSAPVPPPPKKKPKKPPPPSKPLPPFFSPFRATNVGFSAALGVELRSSPTVRFYAQAGPGNRPDDDGHLRAGFITHAGAEWYRPWQPARAGAPYGYVDTTTTVAGGSFANTALVFDALHVLPIGRSERAPEFTLRASLAADSRRRYFANVAELAAGVRVAPFGLKGPSVMLEAVAGRFGIGAALPAGAGRSYGALRPSITQSVQL